MKIEIDIRPSKFLLAFIMLLCLAAISVSLWIEVSIVFKLLLIVSLLFYTTLLCRRHCLLKGGRAVTHLSLEDEKEWTLTLRDGSVVNASLAAESYLGRFLVILNFRVVERLFLLLPVVLLYDSVGREQLRQLRVYLRHKGGNNG